MQGYQGLMAFMMPNLKHVPVRMRGDGEYGQDL